MPVSPPENTRIENTPIYLICVEGAALKLKQPFRAVLVSTSYSPGPQGPGLELGPKPELLSQAAQQEHSAVPQEPESALPADSLCRPS